MTDQHRKHNPQLHMAINNRTAAFEKYIRHIDTCWDCMTFAQGYIGPRSFCQIKTQEDCMTFAQGYIGPRDVCQEGLRLMEDYCYYVEKTLEHGG